MTMFGLKLSGKGDNMLIKKSYEKWLMPRLLMLILGITTLMTVYPVGCATLKPEVTQTLALSKASAETIARTAIQMNREGKLSEKDLTRIQELYNKGQKAQSIVIESLKMSLELGQNPKTNANYNAALQSYAIIIQQLLNLAIELKLVK